MVYLGFVYNDRGCFIGRNGIVLSLKCCLKKFFILMYVSNYLI